MGQELEAILTEDVQDHCGLIAGTEETGDAWRREKLSRRPVQGEFDLNLGVPNPDSRFVVDILVSRMNYPKPLRSENTTLHSSRNSFIAKVLGNLH